MTDAIVDHAYTCGTGEATAVDSEDRNDGKQVFSPFATFKATRRFGSLDGWRAFAILAVIWRHSLADSFASPIAQEGRHGVTLFFVISGFLIITLLLRSKESPAGFSLWKFWGRRALRILPIYYTVLVVYIVLVTVTDHSAHAAIFFRNLPFFATFTTNWFVRQGDHTIFFFSWSLAAEEQFYLIWPLIEVIVPIPWLKFTLLVTVAIASRAAVPFAHFGGLETLPTRMLAGVPLAIALGTGLAHLLNHEASFRIMYRVLGRRGSVFGCLGIAAITAVISPEIGFVGELMVPVALMLLVASTVIREDNDVAGLLRWQPIVWIGMVSYGMYLMHMLALNTVERAEVVFHIGSPVVLFIGSIAVAVALASISFQFYEKPFLVLKDRFFRDQPPITETRDSRREDVPDQDRRAVVL